jgi:twitching motility protein PilJ
MLEQMLGLLQEGEDTRRVIETERAALEAAVGKLAQEVGQLATGDLSTQAEVNEAAVTRAIAEALNFAVGELRGLVLGVENTTTELSTASASLSEMVQTMAEQATTSAKTAERAVSAHEATGW